MTTVLHVYAFLIIRCFLFRDAVLSRSVRTGYMGFREIDARDEARPLIDFFVAESLVNSRSHGNVRRVFFFCFNKKLYVCLYVCFLQGSSK